MLQIRRSLFSFNKTSHISTKIPTTAWISPRLTLLTRTPGLVTWSHTFINKDGLFQKMSYFHTNSTEGFSGFSKKTGIEISEITTHLTLNLSECHFHKAAVFSRERRNRGELTLQTLAKHARTADAQRRVSGADCYWQKK